MSRMRRRGHSRSRSSRKTRWTGGIWQGDFTFNGDVNSNGIGLFHWVSFWFKWPAGHNAPQIAGIPADATSRVEPSDETLVRTKVNFDATTAYNGVIAPVQTWDIVAGLIAWDGGDFPEFFDLGIFSSSSFVAPPNPAINPDDDWILRNSYGVANANPRVIGDTTDTYLNSLAKRKLPPDTGILGVIGVANVLQDDTVFLELTWNWDVRFAVRTGYTA